MCQNFKMFSFKLQLVTVPFCVVSAEKCLGNRKVNYKSGEIIHIGISWEEHISWNFGTSSNDMEILTIMDI